MNSSKSGFLRRVLLIAGLAYIFDDFVIESGLYMQSDAHRELARAAILLIAAMGIVTLLARRINR